MQFKLQYLLKKKDGGNAFSEYGTLCHTLLEEWAFGKLFDFELAEAYDKRYCDAVVHLFPPFPKGYAEKAFNEGLTYFQNFTGFGDNFEIMTVEEKFTTKIGQYDFVGIADLVVRDKVTGEYIVYDHKTKSLSSMKKEMDMYRKQLYTYAKFVYEKFGVYPSKIIFNMIKSGTLISENFDINEYNKTIAWLEETIDMIYLENEWPIHKVNYFCNFICGAMSECPNFN